MSARAILCKYLSQVNRFECGLFACEAISTIVLCKLKAVLLKRSDLSAEKCFEGSSEAKELPWDNLLWNDFLYGTLQLRILLWDAIL